LRVAEDLPVQTDPSASLDGERKDDNEEGERQRAGIHRHPQGVGSGNQLVHRVAETLHLADPGIDDATL